MLLLCRSSWDNISNINSHWAEGDLWSLRSTDKYTEIRRPGLHQDIMSGAHYNKSSLKRVIKVMKLQLDCKWVTFIAQWTIIYRSRQSLCCENSKSKLIQKQSVGSCICFIIGVLVIIWTDCKANHIIFSNACERSSLMYLDVSVRVVINQICPVGVMVHFKTLTMR